MGRASDLYLKRKHRTPRMQWPRPYFTTNSLRTHFRPHVMLPELQDLEDPNARLATVPVEVVLGRTERPPDLSDIDPDFL